MPNRRPANSCTRVSSIVSVMVLIAAIPPGRGPPDGDLGWLDARGAEGSGTSGYGPIADQVRWVRLPMPSCEQIMLKGVCGRCSPSRQPALDEDVRQVPGDRLVTDHQ